MTLDKKMVYKITGWNGEHKYTFTWDAELETWRWEWPDGYGTPVEPREVQEMISICEHFPDYRTLTISPNK